MTGSDDGSFDLRWPTDAVADPNDLVESVEPIIDDSTSIWCAAEVGDIGEDDVDGVGWPAGPVGPSVSARDDELVDETEPHVRGPGSAETPGDERRRLTMRVRLVGSAATAPRRTPRI